MPTTAGAPADVLDRTQAIRLRAAWADVMAGFVPGLAILEETLCRAAEAVRARTPARVLDVGGGPGVLAERMARRWSGAAVTLVDLDPVLLALARDALQNEVRALDGDLSSGDWVARAGGNHDLITVIMTLHYLPPAQVRAFYDDAYRSLVPGGLLVVADLMPDDGIMSLMNALDPAPGEAAAEFAWAQWWSEVGQTEPLRRLLAARTEIFRNRPPAEFTAPASWHVAAARDAGFTDAGILWRCGRHAALAAVT